MRSDKSVPPNKAHFLPVISLLLALVFMGCVHSTRFVLDLKLNEDTRLQSRLRVASVERQGRFVRVYKVTDLDNLRLSLTDTISNMPDSAFANSTSVLDIHVMVRSFILMTTNMAGATLSCVEWAVTDTEGEIIFKEQFYAAKATYLLGSIANDKNVIHKAMVSRIVMTAMHLASGRSDADTGEMKITYTYDTYDEARARLPNVMVSMSSGMTPSSRPDLKFERTIWHCARPKAEFDWDEYLSRLKEDQP